MREITIKLNNNNDYIKVIKDVDGLKETKYISTDDLIELLNASKDNKNERVNKLQKMKFESGILPSSNGVSVLSISETFSGNKRVVIKKEACNHDFPVYDNMFEKVGLPTLIFVINITNNQITNGRCFATKTNFITEDTELFRYPFPNVGLHGDICFGGGNRNNLKIENIYDLHSFPNKFIMMPTTHELATNYQSKMPLRKFLEGLQNKPFNLDELITTGKTVKSII